MNTNQEENSGKTSQEKVNRYQTIVALREGNNIRVTRYSAAPDVSSEIKKYLTSGFTKDFPVYRMKDEAYKSFANIIFRGATEFYRAESLRAFTTAEFKALEKLEGNSEEGFCQMYEYVLGGGGNYYTEIPPYTLCVYKPNRSMPHVRGESLFEVGHNTDTEKFLKDTFVDEKFIGEIVYYVTGENAYHCLTVAPVKGVVYVEGDQFYQCLIFTPDREIGSRSEEF